VPIGELLSPRGRSAAEIRDALKLATKKTHIRTETSAAD
jgi:hypothetical protein